MIDLFRTNWYGNGRAKHAIKLQLFDKNLAAVLYKYRVLKKAAWEIKQPSREQVKSIITFNFQRYRSIEVLTDQVIYIRV